MKRLIYWLNILVQKRKALKRWQRIVTVLAAIITFVTTYTLILPAITVERESADEVAGMYLDVAEDPVLQTDEVLEENALVPLAVQIAAEQDNAVTYLYEDEDMSAVAVFAGGEKIPEGAELVVSRVIPESEMYVLTVPELLLLRQWQQVSFQSAVHPCLRTVCVFFIIFITYAAAMIR